ncbi:cysteine hydrolase family protein [Sinomonas atrocyanea]|uniref:cysteine hydrolase family protein n=1 Tax=Sinomonas atrocyanea TaxID=37927 RepID=UPI002782C177|nr:isochorismatase family protein [Sinomonas atrocyanea]MDQ0260146.1 nicotinamidase-related amidase [Sinomonas atrocyanea]MDR6620208.1 nicotinamidase-related amidase [Sinomonas atrocyanea]
MALTALDPRTALVVIDLQKGITGRPQEPSGTPRIPDVVAASTRLADAFRAASLPVVLVNVAGAPAGRTELGRRLPAELPEDFAALVEGLHTADDDVLLTKRSVGAFATTDLDAVLRGLGVTQIVLAGISTSMGVESTARAAHDLGYSVALAVDAMTDFSPGAHEYAVSAVFPRLGETGTAQDVLDLLAARQRTGKPTAP